MLQYKLNEEFGTPLFNYKDEIKSLYIKIFNKFYKNVKKYKDNLYPTQEIIIDNNELNINLIKSKNIKIRFIIYNSKLNPEYDINYYFGTTDTTILNNNIKIVNNILISEKDFIIINIELSSKNKSMNPHAFYDVFIHEYTHFYEYYKRKEKSYNDIGFYNKLNYNIVDNFIDKDNLFSDKEKLSLKGIFYHLLTPTERNAFISRTYADLMCINKNKKFYSFDDILNETEFKEYIEVFEYWIEIIKNINYNKFENFRKFLIYNHYYLKTYLKDNYRFKKWIIKTSLLLIKRYKAKIYKMVINYSDLYNNMSYPNNNYKCNEDLQLEYKKIYGESPLEIYENSKLNKIKMRNFIKNYGINRSI